MGFDIEALSASNPPRAAALFTDREPESKVLKETLKSHRTLIDNRNLNMAERRNVLVFYGVGGVGKSTLSERLEDWVNCKLPLMNGWGREPVTKVDVAIRTDLRDLDGQFDALGAVLSMRRALGVLKKHWPAFDFAFTAYWEAAHPGESVPGHGKLDNGFSEAVSETIENVFTDLDLLGTIVGVGSKTARAAIREMRRRKLRRLAFESYDGYRDLLERCSELPSRSEPRVDLVVELAMLLAFELSNWNGPQPLVVVFVDTFERLILDTRRIGEKLMNQLVWNMPNVLFVITGRNYVDWYDGRRTNLHRTGRSAWPTLVPRVTSDLRQHLVGKLSPSDRRRIIRLGCEKYQVSMSDQVVDDLVIASGGLPLYLDLALAKAIHIMEEDGREVTVEDVTGSLDDLVLHVLDDVPADEQRAIRAAALFLRFDVRLIAITANVDFGVAERAVRRPMVESMESDSRHYRLHDEIRSAIRWSSHHVAGGWSLDDWKEAGSRALVEARSRYEAAAATGRGEEGLSALGLAISIVADQDVKIGPSDSGFYKDWLSQAIVHGPSIGGLRKYVPSTAQTAYGQFVLDFIFAKSYELSCEQRAALLRRIFDSDHPLALPAGRHLGYQFRNSNCWDESLEVFQELISRSPTELNRYQRRLTLATARRFVEAADGMSELTDRRPGLQSNLEMSHGRPGRWLGRVQEVLNRTASEGRQRDRLEHLGASLRWRTILVGDVDRTEVATLENQAISIGYELGEREALSSLVLLTPGPGSEENAVLDRLEYLDRKANDGLQGFRTATVRALRAYVSGDIHELRNIRDDIENQPIRGRNWIPVECLLNGINIPVRCPSSQWIEPYQDVEDRWMQIFQTYRSRVEVGAKT